MIGIIAGEYEDELNPNKSKPHPVFKLEESSEVMSSVHCRDTGTISNDQKRKMLPRSQPQAKRLRRG